MPSVNDIWHAAASPEETFGGGELRVKGIGEAESQARRTFFFIFRPYACAWKGERRDARETMSLFCGDMEWGRKGDRLYQQLPLALFIASQRELRDASRCN